MNDFARRPVEEQRDYFQETASKKGIPGWTVEKDFWVCWLLGVLFDRSGLGPHLVFKGGTSLSKVYGIINRFSEDIDLSVSPEWLGFTGPAPASRSGREKWFVKLQGACSEKVIEVQTRLEGISRENLGVREPGGTYFAFESDPSTHSPVLLFSYPAPVEGGPREPRRRVKLEFGSLTDQKPTATHFVTPWVAELFPSEFTSPSSQVTALEAERTFWEKATLLHAYFHYPEDKPIPPRLARHMYDIHCLAAHSTGQRALRDLGLLDRVREFKSLFFNSGWANYGTAKPGTLHVVPPEQRLPQWRKDYADTEEMFIGTPPPLDALVDTLRRIEAQLNGGVA